MNKDLILLVDDELDICSELNIYLSRKGYEVVVANNGREAIDKFKKHNPILVLTDYKMPIMDGVELLQSLKSISKDIQVILMSGVADIQTRMKALNSDAFEFLEKPIDIKRLEMSIKTAISRTLNKDTLRKKLIESYALNHETLNDKKNISILTLNLNPDENSKDRYKTEFSKLLSDSSLGAYTIINMEKVDYINNIGLNQLIDFKESLESRNCIVYMCNVFRQVKDYLVTLGYIDFFNIETTLETALSAIEKNKD